MVNAPNHFINKLESKHYDEIQKGLKIKKLPKNEKNSCARNCHIQVPGFASSHKKIKGIKIDQASFSQKLFFMEKREHKVQKTNNFTVLSIYNIKTNYPLNDGQMEF